MTILDCKSCGMEIVLSPRYNKYKGEIECGSCNSVYFVEIVNGKVKDKELKKEVALA